MSGEKDRRSYLFKKTAYYSGKAATRPFVAMVGSNLEDKEPNAAPKLVQRELLLATPPDEITENEAKRLTESRQMLRAEL